MLVQIEELPANLFIINKYKNKSGWTLFYCPDHGPFVQQNAGHNGICVMCKKKVSRYNEIIDSICQ